MFVPRGQYHAASEWRKVHLWVLREWIIITATLLQIILRKPNEHALGAYYFLGALHFIRCYIWLPSIFARFIHILCSHFHYWMMFHPMTISGFIYLLNSWLVSSLGLLQIMCQWIHSYVYRLVYMCIHFCWVYT